MVIQMKKNDLNLLKTTACLALLALCATSRGQEPSTNAPPTAPAPAATNATNAPSAKLGHDTAPFGRLTLGATYGDDLSVYSAEAMFPLFDTDDTALFLNPRGLLLEDDDQELNIGLVLRRLTEDEKYILGVNFYYDARFTDADNTLQQVGGGLEMLSKWFDARANYYYPVNDEKSLESGTCPFTGAAIPCTGVEEAMEGFDAEVGVWLSYFDRHLPMGLFAGYYRFESDVTSEKVDGMKVRVEMRPSSNLTFDAAWFEDSGYRDSEYVVGARLHVPLDFWNGLKMDRGGARLPDFPSRISEPVQRDFRVRTLITRPPAQPAPSGPAAAPAARPARSNPPPKPDPVCSTYPALDKNGDVIFITVCE